MPKFEKSTGYKMKGSTLYGKSVPSTSPLKVSDRDVVAAQAQLDKVETKFRQPGWARAAYKVHKSILNPMSKDTDLEAKSKAETDEHIDSGSGGEEKAESVSQRMGNTGDLEGKQTQQTNFPQSRDNYSMNLQAKPGETKLGPMMTGSSATPYRKKSKK